MTSKNDPGIFDAYAKAEADEPVFTLLGRDPVAPALIEAWAYLRSGQVGAAEIAFKQAMDAATHINPQMPGEAQIRSAFEVAESCRAFVRSRLISDANEMNAAPLAAERPQAGRLSRLILLALPVAATNLLFMTMGLVDTIVVGHHSRSELAELALAWSLNGTALVFTLGLLVGVQVLAARRFGEGRPEAIGAIWRRGMLTGVLAGLGAAALLAAATLPLLEHLGQSPGLAAGAAPVAAILGLSLAPNGIYLACAKTLEAVGRPKANTLVILAANGVNLATVVLLVPSHGAEGAAWGTFAARMFMAVASLTVLFSMRGARRRTALLDFRRRSDPGEAREQMSVGMSAAGSRVLEAGSFNALSIMAGVVGEAELAVFVIMINVMSAAFMPAMGTATASAVLVSQARGAGDAAGARAMAWLGLAVASVWALVFSLAMLVFAAPVARAFTDDATLSAAAAIILARLWIMAWPDFLQVVAAEALRALGRPWFATLSHLASYVAVMAPLGWYLGVHLERGSAGLLEAIALASLLSAGILIARLALVRDIAVSAPAERTAGPSP